MCRARRPNRVEGCKGGIVEVESVKKGA